MNNNLPSTPKYKNARLSLLLVLIFSVINVFAVFTDTYFLFSSRLALVLVAVGAELDAALGETLFVIVFAILAIISLVPYLLCWIFSKKRVGWLIVGLVLFAVDTIILLIDVPGLIAEGNTSIIIDVVVHVIVIVELIIGVKAGYAMKKEALLSEEQAQQLQEQNEQFISSSEYSEGQTREITFARKKSFVGAAVAIVVCANGREVCRLKNGESKTVELPMMAFELTAMLSNGFANVKEIVSAGETAPKYTFQVKMGLTTSTIEITKE